jgi:hypothetical protein
MKRCDRERKGNASWIISGAEAKINSVNLLGELGKTRSRISSRLTWSAV